MRRLVMVVLLLFTVVVAANYQKAVYVNADQTLAVDTQAELTILHVWAEKADAASFRIGQSYQLAGKDIRFSGHLFSITYAISRPDDIKLSLYLASDQAFTIQQQQVFSILPQHMQSANN